MDTRSFVGAGALAVVLRLVPVGLNSLAAGQGNVFADITIFFSQMAVVTFRRRLRRSRLCRAACGGNLRLARFG